MLCYGPQKSIFTVTMYHQIPTGSLDCHLSYVTLGVMIFLFVGVLRQMLGAPVTLWEFVETADRTDPLTTSILEDFSIPSSPMPRSLLTLAEFGSKKPIW